MSHSHRTDGAASCRTIIVTQHCPPMMRKRDIWRVDQFHLLRKVGSGYASTVYLGTCRTSGNQVAVKLYHKQKLSELNHFQVAREITIHSALDHKNIIQMWAAFEDQYGIYMVFEYASKGDVFTEVERRGGQLNEAEAVRQVIFPFLSALDYLHTNYIIHRDIKPENLLFTATGVLKVGDFGLSINFSQERPVTRVGTLDYMAPEVVVCPDKHRPQDHKELKHLHYTPLVDAWAVGVLAYELIVGRPPFDKGQKKATIAEILNAEPFIPPWLSEGATHFIRWSLTKEVGKRPSVQQLAEHPWVVSHMKQGQLGTTRRQLVKTDSFVEPRQLGFRGSNAPTDNAEPGKEPPRPLQVASVAQGGRFLGHSSSMSAMDGMRYRDIHLDSVTGGMAGAATAALSAVKRVSDGDGTTGGRPSAAGGRVSRAGTARNSGAGGISGGGGLSRMNSMSAQAVVAAAAAAVANGSFGGTGGEDSPKAGGRPMTREELLASLTAPIGGRGPVLMRSFTAGRASQAPQQMAPQVHSPRKSGSGGSFGVGSGGCSQGTASPGRSFVIGSGNSSTDLAHDMSRLRVDPSTSSTSGSGGGAQPYTPIRPSPPQAPSPSARGLKNGSPLIPSRLSQSFTSPVSPLAMGGAAGGAAAHGHPSSRLGKTSNSGIILAPGGSSGGARPHGSLDLSSMTAGGGGGGGGAAGSPRSGAASPRVAPASSSPRELPGERDPEFEDIEDDDEEEGPLNRSPGKGKSLFKKIFS